jgi:hypothetical protein
MTDEQHLVSGSLEPAGELIEITKGLKAGERRTMKADFAPGDYDVYVPTHHTRGAHLTVREGGSTDRFELHIESDGSIREKEFVLASGVSELDVHFGYPSDWALAVGNLAHGFLQHWNFTADVERLGQELTIYIDAQLSEGFHAQRSEITQELCEIFGNFFGSPAYAEIAGANILGREVPLLMPWDGQIMEGVIDLVYERNGLLYLADYKTDRIAKSELPQGAENYRRQAEIYTAAASQSLRRPVAAFKLVFLRAGEAVEIAPKANSQLSLFS